MTADPSLGCAHGDTTLLWAYGEAPASHALHVTGCAACQGLLAEHEAVASALGPALGALRGPAVVAPAAARRWPPAWLAVAAIAAAATLAVWLRPADGEPPSAPLAEDAFEAALDDLDREVLDLELELL